MNAPFRLKNVLGGCELRGLHQFLLFLQVLMSTSRPTTLVQSGSLAIASEKAPALTAPGLCLAVPAFAQNRRQIQIGLLAVSLFYVPAPAYVQSLQIADAPVPAKTAGIPTN